MQISLLWRLEREVGKYSRECKVLPLIGHLALQPQYLGQLGRSLMRTFAWKQMLVDRGLFINVKNPAKDEKLENPKHADAG